MILSIDHVGPRNADRLAAFLDTYLTVPSEDEGAITDRLVVLLDAIADEAYDAGIEDGDEDGRQRSYDDGYDEGVIAGREEASESK